MTQGSNRLRSMIVRTASDGGIESPLFRALRPELGRREKLLGQTETPRREVWCFVFLRCRSHLQFGLASGLKKLAPCRLVGVRGKHPTRDSWEHVGAPRRALRGGFLFPTNTWEPPLLTWVV